MLNDMNDPDLDAAVSAALTELVGPMRHRSHPSLVLEVLCLRLSRDGLAARMLEAVDDPFLSGRDVAGMVLGYIARDRERIALALTGEPTP